MPQYLIAIQHPDHFDPASETEETIRDIDALNAEMTAAGCRAFAGGLESARRAKTVRRTPRGELSVTDGPFAEAREHVGGFWILNAADMDEALAWGRKAAIACRTPVEVRAFH